MEASNTNDTVVLVTGGSGFLGTHCILQLLAAGYSVRTTIRNPSKEAEVKKALLGAGASSTDLDRVSFVIADLVLDEGWNEAVIGCTYVLHAASPFPSEAPDHEDELIVPARDGTIRVLRAVAKDGRVKRVVVTSSCAAVAYGHPHQDQPFDELSWTNLDGPGVTAYVKSKTIAETAAWDFVKSEEGQGVELTVICPGAIYGPLLSEHYAASIKLIKAMMAGEAPGCLQMQNSVVDVRDAAALHITAMTHGKAGGQRFIAALPTAMTMQQMALTIKDRLPQFASRVPTRTVPNFLIRAMAKINREAATVAPNLGHKREVTNLKAVTMLGWNPRGGEDAIVAAAESLVKYEIVKI